jgi:hypothetical protein
MRTWILSTSNIHTQEDFLTVLLGILTIPTDLVLESIRLLVHATYATLSFPHIGHHFGFYFAL